MRIFFGISVFLSGLIVAIAIWIVQKCTPNINLNNTYDMWSNGNPTLFFIVFPMPFIAYFLFSMIFVFEATHIKYKVNKKRFVMGYTVLFILLVSVTIYRIIAFNKIAQPLFEYEIGYLNPYSNDLFFNVWTLIAALCISAIISFYVSSSKKINQAQGIE